METEQKESEEVQPIRKKELVERLRHITSCRISKTRWWPVPVRLRGHLHEMEKWTTAWCPATEMEQKGSEKVRPTCK